MHRRPLPHLRPLRPLRQRQKHTHRQRTQKRQCRAQQHHRDQHLVAATTCTRGCSTTGGGSSGGGGLERDGGKVGVWRGGRRMEGVFRRRRRAYGCCEAARGHARLACGQVDVCFDEGEVESGRVVGGVCERAGCGGVVWGACSGWCAGWRYCLHGAGLGGVDLIWSVFGGHGDVYVCIYVWIYECMYTIYMYGHRPVLCTGGAELMKEPE
ncbi:hypothetical protein DFP73DRAFT_563016 [Morchella snyderi]|nr:hypothetical protein DFP73DRAFT_563016 [Morchella snyderi]